MRQVLGPGALGRPRGIRWRGRWEGGSGWGTHVTPWLIHVNVWPNPLQCCEVISLQLIKINEKKKKKRDVGSIPGSGRSPGEGNGNPLQYPCLGNPMDRGAWWATIHGAAKSRTRLSRHAFLSHSCLWSPYFLTPTIPWFPWLHFTSFLNSRYFHHWIKFSEAPQITDFLLLLYFGEQFFTQWTI